MKRVSVIIGVVLGLSTMTGSVVAVNDYFAKAAELELVAMRLDQKIQQDRCDRLQERVWKLQDRYIGREMPTSVREELRRLDAELERKCKQPREDH